VVAQFPAWEEDEPSDTEIAFIVDVATSVGTALQAGIIVAY
jgi:hypothetical protein